MSKYKTILADPPWKFNDQDTRMSPEYAGEQRKDAHYRVMNLQDIKNLGTKIAEVVDDDCFLFLWSPNAFVLNGWAQSVAESWGFTPKQIIPWLKIDSKGKPRIGGGHYTRVCTEQLILCRKGKAKRLVANEPGVIIAPRTEHSVKPTESYELIERLSEGPRLELFARVKRNDWDVWGNEAPDPIKFDAK